MLAGWAPDQGLVLHDHPVLPDHTVHVWHVRIPISGHHLDAALACLDAGERACLDDLPDGPRRREFLAGRATTRTILGSYLGLPASAVALRRTRSGKPELAGGGSDLHFNVSHSGCLALVAVARAIPVGVDVEGVRRRGTLGLASRYFSSAEVEWIRSQPPETRRTAFLRLWTRKEAVVKAAGGRLAQGLQLPVGAGPAPDLVVDPAGRLPGAWRLIDLKVPSTHVAALAVPAGRPCHVVHAAASV
jgi:4'-phosphopantetheinyl transferase